MIYELSLRLCALICNQFWQLNKTFFLAAMQYVRQRGLLVSRDKLWYSCMCVCVWVGVCVFTNFRPELECLKTQQVEVLVFKFPHLSNYTTTNWNQTLR